MSAQHQQNQYSAKAQGIFNHPMVQQGTSFPHCSSFFSFVGSATSRVISPANVFNRPYSSTPARNAGLNQLGGLDKQVRFLHAFPFWLPLWFFAPQLLITNVVSVAAVPIRLCQLFRAEDPDPQVDLLSRSFRPLRHSPFLQRFVTPPPSCLFFSVPSSPLHATAAYSFSLGLLTCAIVRAVLGLASPISTIVGFALPALLSLEALESPGDADDKQWLTYWFVDSPLGSCRSSHESLVPRLTIFPSFASIQDRLRRYERRRVHVPPTRHVLYPLLLCLQDLPHRLASAARNQGTPSFLLASPSALLPGLDAELIADAFFLLDSSFAYAREPPSSTTPSSDPTSSRTFASSDETPPRLTSLASIPTPTPTPLASTTPTTSTLLLLLLCKQTLSLRRLPSLFTFRPFSVSRLCL
jgi:hypothetical protein